MPFQEGNNLGAKSKLFMGAVHRAIAQDDGKRVRAAAEKLLDKAADGEPWALSMLADRLDGKPKQAVEHSGDPEAPVQVSLVTPEQLEEKIRGLVTSAGVIPEVEGDRG